MISPTELAAKAQRLYPRYLSSLAEGQSLFPLEIPCDKSPPEAYDQLQQALQALLAQSKRKHGRGYQVILTSRETRRHGLQQLPSRIIFESEADYLDFMGKQSEATAFKQDLDLLLSAFPILRPWAAKHARRLIEAQGAWEGLVQVLSYYLAHPRPGIYLRELPLPLPSKYIEGYKSLLESLLTSLCPAALNPDGESFEARWGFRGKPKLFFRLRLLDPELTKGLLEIEALSLDLQQLQQVPLPGLKVLVVENEMSFLTLPMIPDTLAIWGQGNQAFMLSQIAWLADRELYYWGDIDTSGLRILAGLRQAFPALNAIWMDRQTLESHRPFLQVIKPDVRVLPEGLTPSETELYHYLHDHCLRLEQEHIPQVTVALALPALLQALNNLGHSR